MLILGLVISSVQAQTWTDEASGVLVAEPGTITANGVGSPSVVWDPVVERYVMFFETRTGAATADCTGGTWSIGIASSDDGLSWDVWPDAVVSPTAGTPWRCVAAHPTAVYDNGTYHLWFKAEQGLNACAAGNNAWGCNNYSGIAHAVVDVDLDDKSAEIDAVEADIEALEAAQPPLDAFADALAAYEADLLASTSEFACSATPVPGICAPCDQFTVTTTKAAPANHQFCQPYKFAIPPIVTITNGGAGSNLITLTITPTVGNALTCYYRKKGAVYRLDASAGGTADGVCVGGTPQGAEVEVSSLRMIVAGGSNNTPTVTMPLNATNDAQQVYTSELLDAFDALEAELASGDAEAVFDLLPSFQDDLQALVTWFGPYVPADPEKTILEADGQLLLDQAGQLDFDLANWVADLDLLEGELADLLAYEQDVDVISLLSQVGLPINKVFGYPAAMKRGNTWVLMYQDYPNVWRATSTSPDGPFVVDAAPVMSAGTVTWAMTEVFDPTLVCNGDPLFKYGVYFGGRSVTAGAFTSGGISDGVSTNAATWLLNTASQYFSWNNVNDFRHFDVIRASDGEHRMWYTDKVNGLVQVNVSSTTAAWDDARSTQRVCQ